MNTHYTSEINTQIVISLLKQHGIKKVIASPGATNINFVASIQQDDFFEIYSCIDERSAAYMACGLAFETGEAVVLSCTGATASRNYMPALTEAYYSKIPIITITSSQPINLTGHLQAQVTDRSTPPSDIVRYSAILPAVNNNNDIWDCEIKANNAILESKRNGGGPVHINLITTCDRDLSIIELPEYRKIDRVTLYDDFPVLPLGRIAIFIGRHKQMSQELTQSIDRFCEANNAAVFCDHTSGYRGKYAIHLSLLASVREKVEFSYNPDTLIHIGEISFDYPTLKINPKTVWRVNIDGEIRDTFKKMKCVFEMNEEHFFNNYNKSSKSNITFYTECKEALDDIRCKIPEVPFSNIWIASKLSPLIPENSTIYLAIGNSLRAWNLFDLPPSVKATSNTGGCGIDGFTSSLIGASLACDNQLYYLVTGDLAFFYDLNALGNRHTPSRVRVLLINNGKGIEFRNPNHPGEQFGDDTDTYIAAAGHYGNKSTELVRSYSENLGYEYITASSKEEFNAVYQKFITPSITQRPMIFEVFVDSECESEALRQIYNIIEPPFNLAFAATKCAKNILGDKVYSTIKHAVKGSK
ncbi:MAG: thiamine pyrophosphate-binding protein [Rikenellaceae bacterium]